MARLGTLFFNNFSFFTNGNLFINRIQSEFSPLVATIKTDLLRKLKDLQIPEKPKRPLNAYLIFSKDAMEKLKKENPQINKRQIFSKCGVMWKALDQDSRIRYNEMFMQSKEQYEKDLAAYTSKLSKEQKLALKEVAVARQTERKNRRKKKVLEDLGKPKRPRNPYAIYITETSKIHNLPMKEFLHDAAESWKNFTDSEKQVYIDKAKKEHDEYERKLEIWENQMRSEGREDLVRKKSTRDKQQARVLKILGKPKSPRNAFALYISETSKLRNLPMKKILHDAVESWKTFTDSEKRVYKEKAEKEVQEYRSRMKIWENHMKLEGRENLFRKTTITSSKERKQARILKYRAPEDHK